MKFKKVLVFLMILAVTLPAFAHNQPKITVTKQNVFRPVPLKAKARAGYCFVNSIAVNRPDAWRCMVGNEISDPCFLLESLERDQMVCGANPLLGEAGFVIKLTKPLPPQAKVKNPEISAWLLKLENGQICRPYTGTMPLIHSGGKVLALQYGCDGLSGGGLTSGLLIDSIVPGNTWHAKQVIYSPVGAAQKVLKIKDVIIKALWQ